MNGDNETPTILGAALVVEACGSTLDCVQPAAAFGHGSLLPVKKMFPPHGTDCVSSVPARIPRCARVFGGPHTAQRPNKSGDESSALQDASRTAVSVGLICNPQ